MTLLWLLSIILSVPLSVKAQTPVDDSFAQAAEILALNRQYDDQKLQSQQELDAANIQMAQCQNDEAAAKINAAAEKAQAKAQAAGNMVNQLGSTVGDWTSAVDKMASGEKGKAEETIKNVKDEAREWGLSVNGTTVSGTGNVSSQGCQANGLTDYNKCTFATNGKKRDLQAQLAEATKNQSGAKDLLSPVLKTALTAGMAAMGNHFQMQASNAQNKATLQNAGLARQQCELNVNNSIANANRALARVDSLRSQDLLNASLRFAANRNLPKPGVDVTGNFTPTFGAGGGGSADGLVGGAPAGGGGGGPQAAGASAGGGGGGGGGPSAGDAPWGFGNSKGDAGGGGGLPQQPEAASFAQDSGGGGGFGGFGSGDAPADLAASEQPNFGPGGQSMALGDGGLDVLLSRLRRRLAAHAQDLIKPMQAPSLAKSPSNEREPSSAKDSKNVNVDRL